MKEEEIEAWYEKEKERAFNSFIEEVKNTKDHRIVEKNHEKKIKLLFAKYEQLMFENLKKQKKKQDFNRKIKQKKDTINKKIQKKKETINIRINLLKESFLKKFKKK